MDHWAGGIFLTRIRQGKEDVRKEKAAASRTAKKRSVSLFRMMGILVSGDPWRSPANHMSWGDDPSVIEFAIAIVGSSP